MQHAGRQDTAGGGKRKKTSVGRAHTDVADVDDVQRLLGLLGLGLLCQVEARLRGRGEP